MDIDHGFIKLWRKSIESRVFINEGLWKVWTWCLMKASHKKRWASIKVGKAYIEVEISPSQFIFGRNSASEVLNMTPSTVWKRMQKLKNMQNININSNSHYSIISIMNWGAYQINEKNSDSEGNSQVTAEEQPGNSQVTQTRMLKNVKNVKEEPLLPPKKKKQKKKTNFTAYLKEKIIENNLIETKDKIIEFYNYRMVKIPKERYNSNQGIDYLFKDLNGCRDNGLIVSECIDEAIGRNWLTPKPSYFKNNNFGNGHQIVDGGDEWIRKRKEARARGDIE